MVKTEIVQLRNVCCTWEKAHTLQSYNLTICSGEIVCVIGFSGSGKSAIEKLLMGEVPLTSGRLVLNGKYYETHNPENAVAQGIYTIGTMNPMVMNFSIAENLGAVRYVPNSMAIYRKAHTRADAVEILQELNLDYSPDKPVAELSFLEERLLSIAKVVRSGARLIIMNCVHNAYSTGEMEQLAGYMEQWKAQGVSFLIICERVTPFFDIADKVQLISKGMDQYQWHKGTFPVACLREEWDDISNVMEDNHSESGINAVCVLDNARDSKCPFDTYLHDIQRSYPAIWQRSIRANLPPIGEITNHKTVLIPKESAILVAENLSVADNLVLCIPKQVGRGGLRVLHKGMQQVLLREFQEMIHAEKGLSEMGELTEAQKKILSIHRWALSRPECILLEDPFWGLDIQEISQVYQYLVELSNTDVRLIVFIRNGAETRYFRNPFVNLHNLR